MSFERDAGGRLRPPEEYPDRALVAVATHDMPTVRGFWTGHDIEWRGRVIADITAAWVREGHLERKRPIGRASCRERVCQYVEISVVAVALKRKNREDSISTEKQNKEKH